MPEPRDDLRHPGEISGEHGRESLFYNLLLPEHGVILFVYTWVDAEDRAGYLFTVVGEDDTRRCFFANDGVPVGDRDFDDWAVDGLTLRHRELLHTADLAFSGEDVEFHATFTAIHDAFSYRQNQDGCPPFIATDRFEQAGRMRGTLVLDGERIEVDATTQRDHSWGQRDWAAIQDWKWLSAQSSDAMALNVMLIHARGETTCHGYVARDGRAVSVVDVEIRARYDERWWQTGLDATIVDEEGLETVVAGRRFAFLTFEAGGVATLNEAACTGTIDGAAALIHLECGWPTAYAHAQAQAAAARSA
ncbi:MAG: hypothetical protein JWM31_2585 [Solirubrobacterales bacterium]|nr:hypothetical protein [Solirubrobacterales bacterium]